MLPEPSIRPEHRGTPRREIWREGGSLVEGRGGVRRHWHPEPSTATGREERDSTTDGICMDIPTKQAGLAFTD